MKSFADLGLRKDTLNILAKKGFEVPTPIQEKTIPLLLTGTIDIVGQAQTGTGKTAAFGIPLLENIDEKAHHVQALILTPTRELAVQVAEEIHSLKGKKNIDVVPIYGGQSITVQLRRLKKGAAIVVGTPGRVIDHIKRKTLRLSRIAYLILDEADEMLNMGFLDEVTEIMKATPDAKQTLLFSATMPAPIMQVAKKYMHKYELIKVTPGQLTVQQTEQIYFEVRMADKFEALCRILDIEEELYGLVFCRTKVDVDTVAAHLTERGYDADGLHGDMSQPQREKILGRFKKKRINILVATDVAARGIDVHNLTHVINYALPQDSESYVHRIGRTGRAGKEGIAITFITPAEYRRLQFIKRETKTDIRKEKLPNIDDVIKMKKNRLYTRLEALIQADRSDLFTAMAEEMVQAGDAKTIVAALLRHSFQDEFDATKYVEISDATSVDTKGTTRLFIRQGKKDGLSPQKLIQMMTDACGVPQRKIRDVQVLDKFSFATLPFNDAETVITHFKKKKNRSKIVVSKAKKSRAKQR